MLLQIRELFKKENTGKYLKELLKNENISSLELEILQKRKLSHLFKSITKNRFFEKYIHDIFLDDKLHEKSIEEILRLLPIINKATIREQIDQWVDKDKAFVKLTTSGSTGSPFEIYHSKESYEIKAASKDRALARFNIDRNELQIAFGCGYGADLNLINKLKVKIHNKYILKKRFFDITQIKREEFNNYLSNIEKINPVSIWSYPSFLNELVCYANENNIKLNLTRLKAVILSGESSSVIMYNNIRNFFEKPIIDEYNSNEGFLASTCRMGKLHINEDTVYMLIKDSNNFLKKYGYGELVLTQFYSDAYPLINYLQGDYINISEEKCDCGSSFRVIKEVIGRSGSVVIYNGDEKVSTTTFGHYIAKSPYIKNIVKFQLIQNDVSHIEIKFVLNEFNFNKLAFESLIKGVFNKCTVDFIYVDDIPRTSSGKFNDFIINI